jgi:N-succinyldiaminopimelate aminotransferase
MSGCVPLLPSAPPITVFERMSALARETGAINLGQGFPQMAEPPELIAAAQRALQERSNQYPPMRGFQLLREAVTGYYAREQGLSLTPDHLVVTSGATEALAAAILALVRPGDEVVLVQPLYDCYLPLVARAGGCPVLIDLEPPYWTLPLDRLAAAIGPKTRLIVLNTPHNPTGSRLDRPMLEAIGALCERHDLLLLCDEVWEAMLLDGPHISALSIPSLADRTVKVGSAGKIFSLTGWKVGWAVAAPPLAALVAAQHQFLTFTTPPALQWAVADSLALPSAWHAKHRSLYDHARDRLANGLQAAGYRLLPADGTWFTLVDLAASGLPADDKAVAEAMIREAGIAAIPVSAFYAERPQTGFLRLCFAKEDAVLDEAVARLARFRSARV